MNSISFGKEALNEHYKKTLLRGPICNKSPGFEADDYALGFKVNIHGDILQSCAWHKVT